MKLLVCFTLLGIGLAFPTNPSSMDQQGVTDYLSRLGYMDSETTKFSGLNSEEAFHASVRKFQAMWGLEVTGEVNDETRALMMTPRCANKDIEGEEDVTKRRKKRYTLQGSKWNQEVITWTISNYTPDMSNADVDKETVRAFAAWSSVANLNFQRQDSGSADIVIFFTSQDGPGNTLAYAFFPQYGGDVYMDEDETWTIGTYSGINLFQVIAHEFGHSLGLSHSTVNEALMAPYYAGYQPNFQLHQDDIDGIQAIYGARAVCDVYSEDLHAQYLGGNYAPGSSVDECKTECNDNAYCVGIDFNTWTNNCYLHTNINDLEEHKRIYNANVNHYRLISMKCACDVYREELYTQYFGGDYVPGVDQVDECKTVCNNNPECYALDFNTQSNTCYLHTDINDVTLTTNYDVNYYRLISRKCVCDEYSEELGVHYLGGQHAPGVDQVDECKTECNNNPECLGLDFNNQNDECWLHTDINKLSASNRRSAANINHYRLISSKCSKVW